ncbi:hypothetical protein ACFOSD_09515 [Salinispirillum marinum]|uniref:Sulfurtransferase complex subunit TusB n=2 Tax=Saccharospirillaceae TaxID=255527 RepID=A0ABV8BGW0_9GAMM
MNTLKPTQNSAQNPTQKSTLHIIFSAAGFNRALPWIMAPDMVLLCGNALAHDAAALPTQQRFALAQDAEQYGITVSNAQLINDTEWVDLVLAHPHRVSWS